MSEAPVLELNTPIRWDSPEARILFSAKDGERTQQSIEKQIETLQSANRTEESYL
jgi:hypothetical protein